MLRTSVVTTSSEEMGLRSRMASSTLPPASLRPSVRIGLDTASSQLDSKGCKGTKHFPTSLWPLRVFHILRGTKGKMCYHSCRKYKAGYITILECGTPAHGSKHSSTTHAFHDIVPCTRMSGDYGCKAKAVFGWEQQTRVFCRLRAPWKALYHALLKLSITGANNSKSTGHSRTHTHTKTVYKYMGRRRGTAKSDRCLTESKDTRDQKRRGNTALHYSTVHRLVLLPTGCLQKDTHLLLKQHWKTTPPPFSSSLVRAVKPLLFFFFVIRGSPRKEKKGKVLPRVR